MAYDLLEEIIRYFKVLLQFFVKVNIIVKYVIQNDKTGFVSDLWA